MNKEKEVKIIPEEIVGHICPYCGHIEMLINQHFAHIEFEHPNRPLV